jgi:cobalamin synthase
VRYSRMRSLLIALQFLTIVPVRISGEITPRAMVWFPVVGLMLGACLAEADLAHRRG